ncbi:MAG: HNH endonuclease [Bellilinea sp.]
MKPTLDNFILEPLPFESYPDKGRKLLGHVSGDNCRHTYGLKFMRLTGLTKCAYCGISLGEAYENWLNMALDHVIPHSTCLAWQVPVEWREDYSNRVLSCTTCNTFGNRYSPQNMNPPSTLEEFYKLRDIIFIERKRQILERHCQERDFFEKKLWETHGFQG